MKSCLLVACAFAFWLDPALQSIPAMEPPAASAPLPPATSRAPQKTVSKELTARLVATGQLPHPDCRAGFSYVEVIAPGQGEGTIYLRRYVCTQWKTK